MKVERDETIFYKKKGGQMTTSLLLNLELNSY